MIDLKQIKQILLNHGIIAFPTETVCGLGIVYDDLISYEKLNKIKRRHEDKPYTMMLGSVNDIEKYAYVNDDILKIIHKYMPGKITLLLKAKESVLPHITHNSGIIGIRIPDYPLILDIINYVGKPLLVPSANRADQPPLLDIDDVKKEFGCEIDYYIQGKALGLKPSTIINCCDTIKIIREGDISFSDIINTLKE